MAVEFGFDLSIGGAPLQSRMVPISTNPAAFLTLRIGVQRGARTREVGADTSGSVRDQDASTNSAELLAALPTLDSQKCVLCRAPDGYRLVIRDLPCDSFRILQVVGE